MVGLSPLPETHIRPDLGGLGGDRQQQESSIEFEHEVAARRRSFALRD
jgi:hypothetical protein